MTDDTEIMDNNTLAPYSDKWLSSRAAILRGIRDGDESLIDMSAKLPRMAFPGGYNPENPRDNLEAIEAEMERRVSATS